MEERKLVDGPEVVLRDSSRRNRNLAVGDDPALFVKSGDPAAVADEAAALARLSVECPELAGSVPRILSTDAERGVLVLERIDGTDLRSRQLDAPGFPPHVGVALGRMLAILHTRTLRAAVPHEASAVRALDLHRPTPPALVDLSSGSLELIGIIQGEPDLCAGIDELRRSWSLRAMIHGDLRWDNVMVSPRAGLVTIVDWEHAEEGDPCWDVGCVIAGPLSAWAFSVPHVDGDPRPERARLGLSGLRPAVAAFWDAYVLGAGGLQPAAHLDRCVRLAGVRLIQSAFEGTQAIGALEAPFVAHLQLGMNLILDPRGAARDLLGIVR